MENFSTPHCHIQSLDTGSTPDSFVARELELGTGTITVTDHGSLAIAQRVFEIATKPGARTDKKLQKLGKLQPIIGLEAYFRDDHCPILTAAGIPKTVMDEAGAKFKDLGETFMEYLKYYHITMHFQDAAAFETTARLLSNRQRTAEQHGSERKPIFTWADLEEIGGTNTIFTSGCLIGMVQRHLLADRPDLAEKYYERVRSIVKPGNFFVEVFPHRCNKNWVQAVFLTGTTPEQKLRFHPRKWLRIVTQKNETIEVRAQDLHKRFERDHEVVKLVGVKHYYEWQEREPFEVCGTEHVEDYIQNECKPWAPDGDAQIGGNRFMLEMAAKFKDPILVSDDAHFAHPEDKIVQDVRLRQSGSWRFFGSYHRQSSEEAFEYFKALGIEQAQFDSWVQNSREWASRFKDFKFRKRNSLPVSFYPKETLKHIMSLVEKHGRMDWKNPQYVQRLRSEITLLYKNGTIDLLPYFMIDEEVCALYERHGELTGPGRGSAAGLLLTYLLDITHVDPLKYNLSQDRFLTIDRIKTGKLPDIDQDLPHRDLLVGPKEEGGWLKERFGDHYAQLSVDTTMKLKSAIKDVYRAMHGDVPGEIHRLCGKLPEPPMGITDREFVFGYIANEKEVRGIIESDATLQEFVQRFPEEWAIVVKCLGLVRQKSRHACAFLISDEPVANSVPMTQVGDVMVTEWTASSIEAVGGLKMDFLVVQQLRDIGACCKLIQQRHGGGAEYLGKDFRIAGKRVPGLRVIPHLGALLDVWDLPEDQAVFRDVSEGKTETVFQLNTPGCQKWLRHFNSWKNEKEGRKAIDSIEAMSAFTALDRPGPLDASVGDGESAHNMLVEFAIRARGGEPIGNMPILDEMLPETYGVIVYQEQLQRTYQVVGNTDPLQANAFREHVSKKKMSDVYKDKDLFAPAAYERLGKDTAEKLWDQMVTFGQYGFNKSHAVSYMFTAYACAWLKHYYPLEWWCAVLRNATRGDIETKFWKHCGHLIDLPDIKYSGDEFEIQNERIRAPLSLLRGIGPGAHKEICELRPYTDITDFCKKVIERQERTGTVKLVKAKLPKKELKALEARGESAPMVEQKVKGRTAINKGVMSTLIISGTADGLFPETDVLEKLGMYEHARAEAAGKRRKDGTVKAEPVPQKYVNINQLVRYQMRKAMLPSYSVNLVPMYLERQVPCVISHPQKKLAGYETRRGKWVFATPKYVDAIDNAPALPRDGVTLALAAYVVKDHRFEYVREDQVKHAAKLLLDVAGTMYEFVKWPNDEGELPVDFKNNLTGALVIVVINKWRADRDFAIEAVTMVQPPLGDVNEESPEPKEDV